MMLVDLYTWKLEWAKHMTAPYCIRLELDAAMSFFIKVLSVSGQGYGPPLMFGRQVKGHLGGSLMSLDFPFPELSLVCSNVVSLVCSNVA